MPRFIPAAKKTAPRKNTLPLADGGVSIKAMEEIKRFCASKVTTTDSRYKDLVEGKMLHELILMGDKLPHYRLLPHKTNPNLLIFVVNHNPILTRAEVLAAELKVRIRDAESLGMPAPVGITDWGESIMPVAQKKVFAPPVKTRFVPTAKDIEPKAPRSVGVVAAIIDALKVASKAKPVTRDGILKILVKKFPDRNPAAMKKTISSQVPGALKTEKGIIVSTDGKGGYWIKK